MAGSSGYSLGVDLGFSFVAAAVNRAGRPEILRLGEQSNLAPATVALTGSLVVGDAAERPPPTGPHQVLRGMKRRVGDPTPMRLAGTDRSVEFLLGQLLADVVGRATTLAGAGPTQVALTHPASWGPYRRDTLAAAGRFAGLGPVALISEAHAAAAAYAAEQPVREGQLVGVYDLGGGLFDATVLRMTSNGFEVAGKPDGFENLGGADFDEEVLDYVRERGGKALSVLDPTDPAGARTWAHIRRDCTFAKELLSSQTSTRILVRLPHGLLQVELTRDTLEDLVRGPIGATVEMFGDVMRSAGVDGRQLAATLLIGGASRMPIVARTIYESLGIRAVTPVHPKYGVALGAAALASPLSSGTPLPAYVPAGLPVAGDGPATGSPQPSAAAPSSRLEDRRTELVIPTQLVRLRSSKSSSRPVSSPSSPATSSSERRQGSALTLLLITLLIASAVVIGIVVVRALLAS